MLLITRRRGEQILIGDDVEITLVKFRNGAVQLGIVAPRDITVLRKELLVHEGNGAKPRADASVAEGAPEGVTDEV